MRNYTRNEWKRCETTLETSREDVKLHSKRVYFFQLQKRLSDAQEILKFNESEISKLKDIAFRQVILLKKYDRILSEKTTLETGGEDAKRRKMDDTDATV